MKKLIFLIVFGLGLMLSAVAEAKPITMDEALDAVCRVNTSGARGSGTVFQEDEENYYVLTNGHVIERAKRGHLEFFQDGYKSSMLPFKTEYVAYEEGTALDLAIVSVKKRYFGRYPPRVIPLAPKGTKIGANDLVMAGGCPSAQWATAWKGRVLNNAGAVISFNAAPIGGQSGSGVLILVKDDKGELQTRLGVLLAWRVGDGAWTDDGPNDYGAGLSLKQIYDIMEGNGKGHPIETSYGLVSEKKETKNAKSAEERLSKICPHCGHKIKDHVVIPYEGGLRKTVRGEFMFCPELKLSDGSIEDTAKYYGGIKVGELYEGSGLFPWCPWDNRPPNQPPQLPPSNPNPPDGGGGDGFNGWPGRPNPDGGPTEPPLDFAKERQEYLDKITELKEKLTNLEGLSESLKAELSGINGNLSGANNEIDGLKDMLGAVEGQKLTLKSRIDELLSFASDKDRVIDELKEGGMHYLDGPTGGNGNTVENVSFTLGGMSLGMLALKYGVPLLLNRRRRKKKKDEDNEDLDREEGYDNIEPSPLPNSDDAPEERVHRHEHIHKHKHENEYIMSPENLPNPRTTHEIDDLSKQGGGLNPGLLPYGFPPPVSSNYYYPQPVAAHGLPPQFPNVPFSTRKKATAEQIMTIFGDLINEYQDDQTMTMTQMDILLRHRLKEKYNIE